MSTALQPTGLMVDLLTAPQSSPITNPNPVLSWIVNDTAVNAHQEASQVLVACSIKSLEQDNGDVWDSGQPDPGAVWKSDNRSANVPYEGPALESDQSYHWKVRTWNGVGNAYGSSQYCTPAKAAPRQHSVVVARSGGGGAPGAQLGARPARPRGRSGARAARPLFLTHPARNGHCGLGMWAP